MRDSPLDGVDNARALLGCNCDSAVDTQRAVVEKRDIKHGVTEEQRGSSRAHT